MFPFPSIRTLLKCIALVENGRVIHLMGLCKGGCGVRYIPEISRNHLRVVQNEGNT